jgi:hypothetical protein
MGVLFEGTNIPPVSLKGRLRPDILFIAILFIRKSIPVLLEYFSVIWEFEKDGFQLIIVEWIMEND